MKMKKVMEVSQELENKVVDMPTVKVPQIQFIAGVSGPSCCATETGYAQRKLCSFQPGCRIWRWWWR